MIMNLLHSGDILCSDNGSLARALLGNNAAKMDDAVAHDDAQAKRAPVLFLKSVDDAVANVVVVGGRIGDLAGEARYRLQQVGARHDADDPVSARHWQTLDVV